MSGLLMGRGYQWVGIVNISGVIYRSGVMNNSCILPCWEHANAQPSLPPTQGLRRRRLDATRPLSVCRDWSHAPSPFHHRRFRGRSREEKKGRTPRLLAHPHVADAVELDRRDGFANDGQLQLARHRSPRRSPSRGAVCGPRQFCFFKSRLFRECGRAVNSRGGDDERAPFGIGAGPSALRRSATLAETPSSFF